MLAETATRNCPRSRPSLKDPVIDNDDGELLPLRPHPSPRPEGERTARATLRRWKDWLLLRLTAAAIRLLPSARRNTPVRRSLWTGGPILNMAVNARAERLLGVEADSLVYDSFFITDAFTYNLRRWSRWRLVSWALPYLVFLWACRRYQRFHFYCNRGLLNPASPFTFRPEELRMLRALGKQVFFWTYGSDVPHASGDAAAGRAELLHGVRFARRRLRLRRRAGGGQFRRRRRPGRRRLLHGRHDRVHARQPHRSVLLAGRSRRRRGPQVRPLLRGRRRRRPAGDCPRLESPPLQGHAASDGGNPAAPRRGTGDRIGPRRRPAERAGVGNLSHGRLGLRPVPHRLPRLFRLGGDGPGQGRRLLHSQAGRILARRPAVPDRQRPARTARIDAAAVGRRSASVAGVGDCGTALHRREFHARGVRAAVAAGV